MDELQDVVGSLGLNTETGIRMPIVFPGASEPIKLRDQAGEPTAAEAYLELLSEDSEAGRAFDRKNSRDAVIRAKRQRGAPDEDPIEWQIERVCALTVGWQLARPDGTPIDLKYSKATARKLFSNPDMAWLRKQALLFIADTANFTKAS
jgi:hypothetical protein